MHSLLQWTHRLMRLSKGQIFRLVNEYIGVKGGYLGQPEELKFSYNSHREFYPMYCELDNINPETTEGKTTREKFINILLKAPPKDQAKIIRGVFKKFPPDCTIPHDAALAYGRTQTEFGKEFDIRKAFQDEFLKLAEQLEKSSLDDISNFIDSEISLETFADAVLLLKERGAKSAMDRVHTFFHGFLLSVCRKSKFEFKKEEGITGLFKIIRENHPAFKDNQSDAVNKIIRSLGSIIDALNPIRNHHSLAHPNENLLHEEESHFVIEIVTACTKYIDTITKKNQVKAIQ